MFWLQIVLPLSLASIGVFLLLVDSYQKNVSLRDISWLSKSKNNHQAKENKYSKFRLKAVEKLEASDDKQDMRDQLKEIAPEKPNAFGEFRYNQFMIVALASLIPFLALAFNLLSLVGAFLLSSMLGIAAYMYYERHLANLVKKKRFQIEAEFPAIIEMLTLTIAAGETPVGAFIRISERSDSKLAEEFSKVVKDVRSGNSFHESLDRMSRNLQSASIRRFIDALVLAMVRGAPIVEVLYRHVAEARINQRNLVMDKAGRAETAMMIPIVFLILPISVLFALWPSINQLSLFAG